MNLPATTQLSIEQAILEGARDIPTFGHIFFPRTFRQVSPQFHYEMSYALESVENRLIGFKVFRDGAKTTLARAYTAKRIAYCISRTIMLVAINGTKAVHSLRWLKRQILFNPFFSNAFKLRQGEKWTDEWISIINSQGETVNVVAAGITSGLRGLNIDDYRPDFIFCDDISDRENTATEEQRLHAEETLFAQLVRSLAPRSESPLSQLVLAQTPINSFDLITKASKDPMFRVLTHSCFDGSGQSSWAVRRSTDSLLEEKQGYIARNQLSMWLAEMECQLVSSETQAFQKKWLKYWSVYPEDGQVVICLDPASSEEKDADYFAISVLLFKGPACYVLEYHLARGMMPDEACAKVFDFQRRYGARDVVVETVAYQKILKWYLEKEIRANRVWLNVHEFRDRRRKDDRIVQAILKIAPWGQFFIREGMMELEEVFELYGPGYAGKVDLLDSIAMGISWRFENNAYAGADVEGEFRRLRDLEDDLPEVETAWRGAP